MVVLVLASPILPSKNNFVKALRKEHPEITCFLVVGCCTDICIQQFALTLKTEFNRTNRSSRVVVPVSMTATYDAPGHPVALIELASYLNMQTSGVEIVSDIGIE